MAIYDFVNDDTGEQVQVTCSMSEYDKTAEELKGRGFRRDYAPLNMLGERRDIYATSDDGWKSTLKRVKNASGRGNTIPV